MGAMTGMSLANADRTSKTAARANVKKKKKTFVILIDLWPCVS
jgi:hypothetical protein